MFIALCTLWAFMFQHRVSTKKRGLTEFLWEGKTHVFTWVFGCVPFIFGGYLSLMAGIQLAWHRLAKERTSKMPNTQPQTPSSSSKMKLYSGHKARHGPRHLREWNQVLLIWYSIWQIVAHFLIEFLFSLTRRHTCLLWHLDEQH